MKAPCRYQLKFSVFNEFEWLLSLAKGPHCQFGKSNSLHYHGYGCLWISMSSSWPRTQWNETQYHHWMTCLASRYGQLRLNSPHYWEFSLASPSYILESFPCTRFPHRHPNVPHNSYNLSLFSLPPSHVLLHTTNLSHSHHHPPPVHQENLLHFPFPEWSMHPAQSPLCKHTITLLCILWLRDNIVVYSFWLL